MNFMKDIKASWFVYSLFNLLAVLTIFEMFMAAWHIGHMSYGDRYRDYGGVNPYEGQSGFKGHTNRF